MPESAATTRPPLALIVTDQEWSTRSIESIIAPKGYAVLRAYSGREALDRAEGAQPDVVIVDTHLPDRDGLDVCRELRDRRLVSPNTPILVTSSEHPSRAQRLAALHAGAWDSLGHPIDAEELLLKLGTFVRAKLESDHARQEGLLDPATGLYNVRGLARRAREVGAEAFRRHTALACVVIGVDPASPTTTPEEAAAQLGEALEKLSNILRSTGRVSDAMGRLAKNEFAVIAPSTDAVGAVKLAQRLAGALDEGKSDGNGGTNHFSIRAGYEAVDNVHDTPVEPVDLLVKATAALRQSRLAGTEAQRFRRYTQN